MLDEYGAQANVPSRSVVIHRGVTMSPTDMEAAYTAAWDEWAGGEDAAAWDATSSDGLADAQG